MFTMKIKNVYDGNKEFVYVCAEDVTVDELCAKFQIKKSDFILYNGMFEKYVVGQEVYVKSVEGVVHRVKAGESVGGIANAYGISEEKLLSDNGMKYVIPGQYLIIE